MHDSIYMTFGKEKNIVMENRPGVRDGEQSLWHMGVPLAIPMRVRTAGDTGGAGAGSGEWRLRLTLPLQ